MYRFSSCCKAFNVNFFPTFMTKNVSVVKVDDLGVKPTINEL